MIERVPILAVDDRRENLVALEAALASEDYELIFARSGDEALARLLEREVALILLDVAMPGMDGYETARVIRSREKTRHIPIIFVTAYMSDAAQIFRGYEEGAVDYLIKPLDIHALRRKVAVFADLYRGAREIERTGAALARAEHEARTLSEALYEVTFEEAPIGIAHVSAERRWLRVNARMAKILGTTPEELRSAPMLGFVHPDDRASLSADLDDVLAEIKPRFRRQCRLIAHDGREVWINVTVSVIKDSVGRPVQLAIIEDVSEEKRLTHALASSERRFAQLRDSGLIGVYELDKEGALVGANDAFLAIIGYSRDELTKGHLRIDRLIAPDSAQLAASTNEELARNGVAPTQELTLIRKDGRSATVLAGAVANGGIVGFVLDVTALREAEVLRARSARELEASLRARDDFLVLLAHELRTPLTPLLMQVSSLRSAVSSARQAVDGAWVDKQLAIVQRAGARLSQVTEDVLTVSRSTVGGFQLEREDLDLAALVRDVVEHARVQLGGSRAVLNVHTDGELKGAWDRAMLERVVLHLLSNAIKYGARQPIDVRVAGTADVATLTIRDRGIGIPEEAREQLFQRFARFAPVQHFGGLGIGLWLVRAIVEAHGGTVSVRTPDGGGAEFEVRLPRHRPAAVEEGDARHQKLLLVDDDDDIREILRIGLENAGYEVRDAANGKEALDAIAHERPDLVLLDLMMPVMTGAEFLSRVRSDSRYRDLPVLVLTAWPAEAKGMPGIQGVLGKPLDISELTHSIERAL